MGGGGAALANYGPLLEVTQPDGYSALVNNDYANLVTGSDQPMIVEAASIENPALALLGYSAIVDTKQHAVVRVMPPPPQAWVARCSWPGGAREVRERSFPRDECVTRGDAVAYETPTPAGPGSVTSSRSGWQTIEAQGPGWLMTVQPWYPGWSATLDGEPGRVEALDGALVGVELPPGSHTVTLTYRPAGLEPGLLTSIVSVLIVRRRVPRHRRRLRCAR